MTEERNEISLGRPSAWWKAGQERRLGLAQRYVSLDGKRILDVGCGLGAYMEAFGRHTCHVYGVDVASGRLGAAREKGHVAAAAGEHLPFLDGAFDVVWLHEVLEHVADDRRAVEEALRCTRPGGHVIIFAPNRLYPFETHGIFLGRRYRFGNIPLVNYLPDLVRNRLVPHARAYTGAGLRRLFRGLQAQPVVHTVVYPGYDKIDLVRPGLARLFRRLTYALERTPLRHLGLSHLLVMEKGPDVGQPG